MILSYSAALMRAAIESAERYLKTGDLKDLHSLED